MATNTTNFGLKKPAYTDTADIGDINGNMDKVDASLNGLADAIAIVANNNTHAAITAGQYVYVHGHGSLAEGLYTAKSNIAANATLSTSNLQADGSGGLNSVYSTLNSNIGNCKIINEKYYSESTTLATIQNDIDSAIAPYAEAGKPKFMQFGYMNGVAGASIGLYACFINVQFVWNSIVYVEFVKMDNTGTRNYMAKVNTWGNIG